MITLNKDQLDTLLDTGQAAGVFTVDLKLSTKVVHLTTAVVYNGADGKYYRATFSNDDAEATFEVVVPHPSVNFVPLTTEAKGV